MVRKKWIGHVCGALGGTVVGLATIYLSYTKLKVPQVGLDWAALILSGLTTGVIVFFVVWGHFQEDPVPEKRGD